jgi:hypothetical protein
MTTAYSNFKLALYCTASCLNNPLDQLNEELDFFQKHLKLSKVYIENHRGDVSLSRARLQELKQFFQERNIEVAGGITPTLGEAYRPGYERLFGGICYTDQASRAKIQEVVENAAAVFDEVILDDFFFTNCGCDDCLTQKGERSWEEFRLELMTEVSENLIMKPAKAINPNVNMVIKFPNWNEAYQASGYNTEKQPWIFDSIYTGTETRDPAISQQHLPRYASYSLLRWTENLKPGSNGGGWFDTLDCTYTDYYLEQAYLTVFGKAKELTLYCYTLLKDNLYVPPLGFQLNKLDALAGQMANPIGVQVYLPHHARGEDHLYDYLGMMGIPMEPTPYFPEGNKTLLITASAEKDPQIIDRMKTYLENGGHIVMTSGFLEKMWGRGAEQFTTLRPNGKKISVRQLAVDTAICTFDEIQFAADSVMYPVFDYSTNGTWQAIVGLNGHNNIPLLMYDNYGKGKIHTLIVPDNEADLWKLPNLVINKIRQVLISRQLSYQLEGPAGVGFFPYDNNIFVLETFASVPEKWHVRLPKGKCLQPISSMYNTRSKRVSYSEDGASLYEIRLSPSTFCAFKIANEHE